MKSKKYRHNIGDIFVYTGKEIYDNGYSFSNNYTKDSLYQIQDINDGYSDYHYKMESISNKLSHNGDLINDDELDKCFIKIESKSSKLLFMKNYE